MTEDVQDVDKDDIPLSINDAVIPASHNNDNDDESDIDWMFIAALCSSLLGLFVLLYIAIRAYKSYGRSEYDAIPAMQNISTKNQKLGAVKKISLRNLGIYDQNEEERNIMHPSSSYTFTD